MEKSHVDPDGALFSASKLPDHAVLPVDDALSRESDIKNGRPTVTQSKDSEEERDDVVIATASDAAFHLLPMRDDFENPLTFRSMFLATALSAFQAVMTQIYHVSALSISSEHRCGLLLCEKHGDSDDLYPAISSNLPLSPSKAPSSC